MFNCAGLDLDKILTNWFNESNEVDVASTIADAVNIRRRRVDAKLAGNQIGMHLHDLHHDSVKIWEASTASWEPIMSRK